MVSYVHGTPSLSSKSSASLRDSILEEPQQRNCSLPEQNDSDQLQDLERILQSHISIGDALILTGTDNHHQCDQDEEIQEAEKVLSRVYTNRSTGKLDLPPDGGYGWVCCFCALFIQFSTWGANSGYGVFLQYYIANDVFPGGSAFKFAWNAGLIVFNAQFWAPLALIAVKMIGFKTTMSIACLTHFAGYILASFATELWQLFCCQGVIMGVSYSFLFVPTTAIIPQWFLKNRGLAIGICVSGTGLGGVVYALAVNAMIQRCNNQRWALRMVGIATFVTIAICIFFIRTRNTEPRQKITWRNFKNNLQMMFDTKVLKAKRLWPIIVWIGLAMIGYIMIVFSFATYATTMGLSTHEASTLTAILNASQVIGRPSLGFIADKFAGRINLTLILEVILAILTFAFWINAKSFVSLLFCAIMIGSIIGVGNVMNTVLIADAFPPEQFQSSWSFLNLMVGIFMLFSEVIALSLRDYSMSNPFIYTQIFAGAIYVLAFFCLLPLREWTVKKILKEKRESLRHELKNLDEKNGLSIIQSPDYSDKLLEECTRYDNLLGSGPICWLRRTTYPIKI